MKIRIFIAAVLAAVLAAPVVASSSSFTDVKDRYAPAVAWANANGMLPPDSRAEDGLYGSRLRVSNKEMTEAIRRFEAMESDPGTNNGYLRREEAAAFLLAGVQKVRELRNPVRTTTATTEAATTTTRAPRTRSRAWPSGDCGALYEQVKAVSRGEYGLYRDYNFTPDQWSPEREFGSSAWDSDVDIIRVTDWYKRFVTDRVFMCQGDAKLNNGDKKAMSIVAIFDLDGDDFYNYWFPTGDQPTCREAISDDWDVLGYNLVFRYSKSRDADRDRIMCEDVLPEHELRPVGDAPPGGVAL